jgi:release factor glutamine methyltransferase
MKALTNFYNENKEQLESWYPGIKLNRLTQEFGENPREEIFQKLKEGMPLEYISGKAAFFHHDFEVTPDTLIPRSETEGLVELTIAELKKLEGTPEVLDIGTGSGAIIISILGQTPIKGLATDISSKALEIANKNYETLKSTLKPGEIHFLNTDRLEGIDKKFHLIVTNPPYIKEVEDKDSVHHQVEKYEPKKALFLKDDEYENWFATLFKDSLNHLLRDGIFLMEGHENHLDDLGKLAEKIGFRNVEIHKDLTNRKRYLKAHG